MKQPQWIYNLCIALAAALLLSGLTGCGGSASPEKQTAKGLELMRKGDLPAAKEILENVLIQNPASDQAAELNNWLGVISSTLGQPDEALAYFETSMRLNSAAFKPLFNAGTLVLQTNDWLRGIRWLRQAANLEPKDTQALLAIGDWTSKNGRMDLAERMYFEVQKRDPGNAAAVTGLGRLALLSGDYAKAENQFMSALEMQRDYPPALYNLGVLQMQVEGQGEQAMEYFRRYLAVAPDGPRAEAASARLGGRQVEQTSFSAPPPSGPQKNVGVLWAQAQTQLRAGDKDKAYESAIQALELARDGGDQQQRGEIVQRVVNLFGDNAVVQMEAGDFWLSQNDTRRAQAAFMQAQSLDSQNPMVLVKLYRASMELEEYDAAVIALRQLIELESGNTDAVWDLADVYGDKLGMTSRGITTYRDFEKRFPADPRAAEVPERVRVLEAAAAEWAALEE